jgi:hypothetical protein
MRLQYGAETSASLLEALPKELRASLPLVGPVEWVPRVHHVQLLRIIGSVQRTEPGVLEDLLSYGQYVGNELANGALKQFMLVVTPKLFAKKLPNLWIRDHLDDGRLEGDIALVDESRLPLRFTGIRGYDHIGVVTLGWVRGVMSRFNRRGLQVKQSGWSLRQVAPEEMACEVSWS